MMLTKKGKLKAGGTTWAMTGAKATYERSRLIQERTLAQRRGDHKEVAEHDLKLAEFEAQFGGTTRESTPSHTDDKSAVLAMLSEKNRKANAEAVRRAEMIEAEKRRRERKKAASGSGAGTPIDPSARLRTVPRTFNAVTPNTTR